MPFQWYHKLWEFLFEDQFWLWRDVLHIGCELLLNHLKKPLAIAVLKPVLTELGIHYLLKSCWPQLSNLWWLPNSVSKGFGTAIKTVSLRRVKRYPTTYRWVSSQLPFTEDQGLSRFIIILSKGKSTLHSHIDCEVSFELSWWDRFHGNAKTFAYWVWHSL